MAVGGTDCCHPHRHPLPIVLLLFEEAEGLNFALLVTSDDAWIQPLTQTIQLIVE